jgi:hypothetical protein
MRRILKNHISQVDFKQNLTEDPVWGSEACVTCHTDIPRLRKGLLGSQVFNLFLKYSQKFVLNISLLKFKIYQVNNCKLFIQFWVASASCETEFKDAVEQTMEQIDVIYRFMQQYRDDFQMVASTLGLC